MSFPQISMSLEADDDFQVALPGAEVTRKRARATKKGRKKARKVIEEEVNEEVIEEKVMEEEKVEVEKVDDVKEEPMKQK